MAMSTMAVTAKRPLVVSFNFVSHRTEADDSR